MDQAYPGAAVGGPDALARDHRYLVARELCRDRPIVLLLDPPRPEAVALLQPFGGGLVVVSPRAIAAGGPAPRAVAPLQADLRSLPVRSASVDAVLLPGPCDDAPAWRAHLDEARRILRPDGLLIVIFDEGPLTPPAAAHSRGRGAEIASTLGSLFANAATLRQRAVIGSLLQATARPSSGGGMVRMSERQRERDADVPESAATPALVLASDAPLPPLADSLHLARRPAGATDPGVAHADGDRIALLEQELCALRANAEDDARQRQALRALLMRRAALTDREPAADSPPPGGGRGRRSRRSLLARSLAALRSARQGRP
jgi:hypothetical protein